MSVSPCFSHPNLGIVRVNDYAQALAAYAGHIATAPGGRIDEWKDIVMCDGGYASRPRNMVVPLSPVPKDAYDQLTERLLTFYRGRDNFVIWNSFPDDLSVIGLRSNGSSPIMQRQDESE